jgi:hypothetical protein
MARKRDIKNQYFTNELLAECSPLARLLGIALLTVADREGRIEDRPKKIKVECLPYDDCSVDELLDELSSAEYLTRYEAEGFRVIQICKFVEHQRIHPNEHESRFPVNPNPDKSLQSASEQTRVKVGKVLKVGKVGKVLKEQSGASAERQDPLRHCPELPPALDRVDARKALVEWATYKAARGESYKSSHGWKQLLNEFEPLGPTAMIIAINHSMARNYSGVFPPKQNSPSERLPAADENFRKLFEMENNQ